MKIRLLVWSAAALLLGSCLESSSDMNRFDAQIIYSESENITGMESRLEIDRGGRAMLWRGAGSTLTYVGALYLLDHELRELDELLVDFDEKSSYYGPLEPPLEGGFRLLEVSTSDWHHEVSINQSPTELPAELLELVGIMMELAGEIEDDNG